MRVAQPLPIGFVSFSKWKLPPLASPRLLVQFQPSFKDLVSPLNQKKVVVPPEKKHKTRVFLVGIFKGGFSWWCFLRVFMVTIPMVFLLRPTRPSSGIRWGPPWRPGILQCLGPLREVRVGEVPGEENQPFFFDSVIETHISWVTSSTCVFFRLQNRGASLAVFGSNSLSISLCGEVPSVPLWKWGPLSCCGLQCQWRWVVQRGCIVGSCTEMCFQIWMKWKSGLHTLQAPKGSAWPGRVQTAKLLNSWKNLIQIWMKWKSGLHTLQAPKGSAWTGRVQTAKLLNSWQNLLQILTKWKCGLHTLQAPKDSAWPGRLQTVKPLNSLKNLIQIWMKWKSGLHTLQAPKGSAWTGRVQTAKLLNSWKNLLQISTKWKCGLHTLQAPKGSAWPGRLQTVKPSNSLKNLIQIWMKWKSGLHTLQAPKGSAWAGRVQTAKLLNSWKNLLQISTKWKCGLHTLQAPKGSAWPGRLQTVKPLNSLKNLIQIWMKWKSGLHTLQAPKGSAWTGRVQTAKLLNSWKNLLQISTKWKSGLHTLQAPKGGTWIGRMQTAKPLNSWKNLIQIRMDRQTRTRLLPPLRLPNLRPPNLRLPNLRLPNRRCWIAMCPPFQRMEIHLGKVAKKDGVEKFPTASFAPPFADWAMHHSQPPCHARMVSLAHLNAQNTSTHSKRCARRSVRRRARATNIKWRVASHLVSVYRRAMQLVSSWADFFVSHPLRSFYS